MAAIDLGKKRIIMIHGLASKPPEDDIHALWSRCLIENIRIDNPALAAALDAAPDVLRHAYWANQVPHHIEDDASYVKKLGVQVDKVIDERQKQGEKHHVGTKERFEAFVKARGLDLVNVFTNALTIKDDVAKAMLREVDLYSTDQYIADQIRAPLEQELRDAWDAGCDVALLSHSMGTFIAYDVLWRFSHRHVPGFAQYRRKKVTLFVTMGSPLCDNVARDLLFARHHKDGKRPYPTNVRYWHNYACLGDVVAHDSNFEDDFFEPMTKAKVIPDARYRTINYKNLHNPFQVVTHKGNRKSEKRNPHKSFGYLVQPRLGTWVADFLKENLKT